jgi:uncharacterized protein (DUF58 family)
MTSWLLRFLIFALALTLLVNTTRMHAAPTGFLEGHLKIISQREVELADGTPSQMSAENPADYPLIILTRDRRKEVALVTADENGNYRIGLPPGDYVLDVQNRRRRHVRAKPQPFTVAANQTAHLDMVIDTGVR